MIKLLALGVTPNTTCWCGERVLHSSASAGNQHALRSLLGRIALVGQARSGRPDCDSTGSP